MARWMIVVLAVAACGDKNDHGGVGAGSTKVVTIASDANVDAAPPVSPAFSLPASQPGPLYITAPTGVVGVLVDGTVQLVAGTKGEVFDLTVGADGYAYASVGVHVGDRSVHAIFKLDGAVATKVASPTVAGRSTALAVDKAGQIYMADADDVYRIADGKEVKLPRPGPFVHDLAVDADNHLVATATAKAWVLVGDTWKPLDIGKVESFTDVWVVGNGDALRVAVKEQGLYRLEAGKAVLVKDLAMGYDRPYIASNGLLAYEIVEDRENHTRLVAPDGGTSVGARDTPGISFTVVDGQGRLWYVDDGALVVASVLGKDVTEYPIGTLTPLLGMRRNAEHDLVAVGSGPSKLPAQEAVKLVTQLTMTLFIGKNPLANTEIEICTFTATLYGTSPCEKSKSRKTATTNARGQVAFENVPLGRYSLAFKLADKWGLASDTYIQIDKEAARRDLGKLRYGPPQ